MHSDVTHLEDNYDWWDKALVFEVVSGPETFFVGVAHLPGIEATRVGAAMRIALVAPSAVPFGVGGAEKLWWGLSSYVNRHTPHAMELIKLPVAGTQFLGDRRRATGSSRSSTSIISTS